MTKLKQFSNKFDVQGKTIHELGEYRASQTMEHPSQGMLGESEFYRALQEATGNQGMIS